MTATTADDLVEIIRTKAQEREDRLIVAIAGPPGSGKTTLTESLADRLEHAAILPMDGFHLDNETLAEKGLLHRKGAPETFDPAALYQLLERVRAGETIDVPTFDRVRDCVVPQGAVVHPDTQIVLVEGNYLLLDRPVWRDLHRFWDCSVFIAVPEDVLEQRLFQRWIDHGLSPADARKRARENDLVNAEEVRRNSVGKDFILANGQM